jgi:hypothetical protein
MHARSDFSAVSVSPESTAIPVNADKRNAARVITLNEKRRARLIVPCLTLLREEETCAALVESLTFMAIAQLGGVKY